MRREPHAGHGPHEPSTVVPRRRPGSARRTSTIDLHSPSGPLGPLVVRGHARDLVTRADGRAVVLGVAEVEIIVDRSGRPTVSAIHADPSPAGLARLPGTPAMSGYRGALTAALPDEVAESTLLHALLDDVPGATIISGYPASVEPVEGHRRRPPPVDVCSGWRSDGTMMVAIRRDGAVPRIAGPPAPDLQSAAGDPLAWHEMPPLSPRDMRRCRRMDVVERGDVLVVDAMFRDHYVDSDGDTAVVHEYGLSATVARDDPRILEIRAEPRVLPWDECPVALASATRLAGQRLGGLRGHIRAELTGISTCTHLNDLLRPLDDVIVLATGLKTAETS